MKAVAARKPPVAIAPGLYAGAVDEAFDRLFGLQSPDTTELLLVRNAEPDFRAALKTRRPDDPPLTERGRCQAMRLAMRLRGGQFHAVYTSTMRPAVETAAVIAASRDLPMVRAPQLRDVAFNPQAGYAAHDPERLTAELAVRFLNRPRWDAMPGFEPSRQFRHRVIQAIEGIVAAHPGQRVVVVTHAGAINAYLSMVLDIDRDMFFFPEHASVSSVRVMRDLYSVQDINDRAHLLPSFAPR